MTSHVFSRRASSAFTLIELLVVVSIISLLSSIIFATGSYARARSTDAAQAATMYSLHTAVAAYTTEFGVPPPNYTAAGDVCIYNPTDPDGDCGVAFSDELPSLTVLVNGEPLPEPMNRFQASMNVLVQAGYLSAIPESANNDSPLGYFDFGEFQQRPGPVLFGALATRTPTTTGESGSCRFTVDNSELEEEPVSVSPAARFIAGLTTKVAQAADFFHGPGLIFSGQTYYIGEGILDYQVLLSDRWHRVQPLGDVPEFSLDDDEDEQSSHCLFNTSCSTEETNAILNDDNIEIPTCSSDIPNRSHCLCL